MIFRRAALSAATVLCIAAPGAGAVAPDEVAPAFPADAWLGPAPRADPFAPPPAEALSVPKAVVPVPAIETGSKAAVRSAFNTYYNLAMPAIGFTGSTATCTSGAISLAFQEWTISRINFLRAMAGVPGNTTLDSTKNAQQQAASLYMSANSTLTHTPAGGLCFSQAAYDGANTSNLAFGTGLTDSIPLYMSDPGTGNEAVGHRRWILHSRKQNFGLGQANGSPYNASALYVISTNGPVVPTPNGITWPPRGNVPLALFPSPFPGEGQRWSFGYAGANFAAANVAVTLNGAPLATTVITRTANGYGDNTLGWSLPVGHTVVKGSVYDVAIGGIAGAGVPASFNYQVLPFNPADPVAEVRGDSNADGKSDLFWRDSAGGLSWWQMDSNAISAANYFNVGTEWVIADVGDLNGDGKADLVWRRTSDGATYLWTLNGQAPTGYFDLGVLPPAQWTLAGTGDLNGDGRSDVVWRGSDGSVYVWLMNGGVISSQGLAGNPGAAWVLREIADLNGDGRADLVFRHTNGSIYVWFMNGVTVSSGASVGAADPAVWSLVGAGDFNGDGRADLLWRGNTGEYYVYLMNGAAISSQGSLGNPGLDWTVQSIGDFNGDGRSDLVLRNAVTGAPHLWTMSGTVIATSSGIANPFGTWQIAGP